MRWIAESLRSLKIGTDLNRSARESEVTCGSYHGAVLHDEMWCGDRANTDKMIDTLDAVVAKGCLPLGVFVTVDASRRRSRAPAPHWRPARASGPDGI